MGGHGGPGRGPGGPGGRGGFGRFAVDDIPEAKLNYRRLLNYLKPYVWQVTVSLCISAFVTLIGLIPPKLIGIILDRVITKHQLQNFYSLIIYLAVIYVVSNVLGGLKGYIMGRLSQKIIYDMWQDLYRSLQRLSFSFYDNAQTGNLMSRITNDVGAVERVIVDGVDVAIMAVLTFVGITFVLFFTNWKLALIAIVPIPVLAVLIFAVTIIAHKIYQQVRKKMGEISALLQDSLSGIREIKSFGREEYEVGRLSEKSTDYLQTNLQAIKIWSIFSPAIVTTTSIGTVLVLLFGGKMAITDGSMTAGQIVSFLFYLGLFYQPIHQLNQVNHMLQHARAASERIFEVIDAVPEVQEAPGALSLPRPIKGEVVFHKVRFEYKKGVEVLHGVDFEARQSEIIALVGPTGAGKTTIVSLIPRFYDSQEGMISIDGIDVKKLKLKDLRENIGIVMQEPFLFNGTVRENIAYGKLGATLDEIIEVAKLANCHEFIMGLADGYEHQIGERGIRLSVGEKQRVAIARALLKNPPILILDEATSSVDNRTEALIQQAIDHLLRKRTSFVIAHRLSTVLNANKILVVQEGKIVETGTHSELLSLNGVYADLYNTQWRHLEHPAAQ